MSNDAEPPVYSVAELNTLVNNALTTHIGSVLVEGEVTGFMLRQGRWATFDLRDPESSINCFVIRQKLHTGIEDGMRVRILGSPRIYVPYGKYSLNVTALQPVGEGALRRAYELLKRRLEAEGIFGKQHKRVPPAFPESIGLITSAEGAALGDVRRILDERWGGFQLILAPVAVQGKHAAASVVRAIEYFNQHHPVSTIIVTRGGGSLEDLQAFNDERVVRAIFGSRIPIIAAIGHEQDHTLAELAADLRAATPSNAAQRAVPDRETVRIRLDQYKDRSTATITRRIHRCRESILGVVARLRTRLTLAQSTLQQQIGQYTKKLTQRMQMVHQYRVHLVNTKARTTAYIKAGIAQRTTGILHTQQILEALNPLAVLERGYSFTVDSDSGKIIRQVIDVQPGQRLSTRVRDGSFYTEVV